MRDVVLVAFSPAGAARIIASDHVQMDAPAWMGEAPDLYLAAGGGEECYFFSLDPDQPDAPSGVLTFAVYALNAQGFNKTTMLLPSGFSANSAGQFIKADSGESMWVLSDDQTSSSNLHLIRRVQGVWTSKRNTQIAGVTIPVESCVSLAGADGVGTLDYVSGAALPTAGISSQALDDLGSYRLLNETLTGSGFSQSINIRDVMSAALGDNTNFVAAPSFAPRTAYPPPPFWTGLVGVEVQA